MRVPQSQVHAFDELGRLIKLRGEVHGGCVGCDTILVNQGYTYGASGELIRQVSAVAGLTTRTLDFVYDDQHQLTGARNPDDPGDYEAEFAYSPGGKLVSAAVRATSATVASRAVSYEYEAGGTAYPDPEAVKVLRAGDGSVFASYQHDSLGNVTWRQDPSGVRRFQYDLEAQRRVRAADGTPLETYYPDAGGLRTLVVERTAGVVQRIRFRFGESEIWYDGAGAVTHRFCDLSHGAPVLRMQDTPTTGQDEVVFTSPWGHILGAVGYDSGSQHLSVGFQYGPYGEILQQSGETATHLRRFNGKEQDGASGLYYYGYRYFDPLSLRWTQPDPLYLRAPELAGATPRRGNLYQFSANNPVGFVDPLGLEGERPIPASPGTGECIDLGPKAECVQVIEGPWETVPGEQGSVAKDEASGADDFLVRSFLSSPSPDEWGVGTARGAAYRGLDGKLYWGKDAWRMASRDHMTRQCSGGRCDRTFRLIGAVGRAITIAAAVYWGSIAAGVSGGGAYVAVEGWLTANAGAATAGAGALAEVTRRAAPAAGGGARVANQGFRSFSAFKRAMGPAGEGMQWHHIVEQTPGNIARFGPEAVHNTGNLVRLETGFHRQVSALYSSIRPDITGSTSLTVRQWLSSQSFEAQASFGQRVMQNISSGAWP